MKKHKFNLMLNEIKEIDDPTLMSCSFIILDFEISGNNVIVDRDAVLEGAKTLINKPIVGAYNQVEEYNTATDNFGTHEQYLGKNRYGDDVVKTNTIPIGVFTTEGYLSTINVNGEDKEVVMADAVLWQSRFTDACDLIQEWYDRGININTSCEYLYSNYSMVDGVEHHHAPIIFEGHCVLASESRGSTGSVAPAYSSSKLVSLNEKDITRFNKLVAQAINQEEPKSKEENNKMEFFKKVFQLSHSDIRSLLYGQLDPTLGENVYSYISDVYDNEFVVELEDYTNDTYTSAYYKYTYTKTDTGVTINLESKSEVALKRDWVGVTQVEQMQNSLDEKATKVTELETQLSEKETKFSELETQLNEATGKVETLTTEKSEVQTQFNEATEKLTQLNSQVDELRPFKEQAEKEQFEKALNEKKEHFEAKFKALNASDKFESEEVQDLVNKSVYDNEDGKGALLQLNSMLVDLVTIEDVKKEKPAIRELSSKRENLIPSNDSFESRFSL